MKFFLRSLIAFVFLLSWSPNLLEAREAPRTLKVGVAVTGTVKRDRDWKQKFEKRLAYASRIFNSHFQLKFQPARYWDWPFSEDRQDSDLLMHDLKRRFPLAGVDLVMGLSRLTQTEALRDIRDLDVLGRTQPFSGYIVIRYPEEDLFKIQEETILIHELGHLFGAIHTNDRESIMSPIVGRQIPSAFDSTNREIIRLTRDMDFKKGIQDLDDVTIEQLLASYVHFMTHDQPFEFYYALGNFYLKLGQMEDALKALQAAARQEPEKGKIYYDLGMLYWRLGRLQEAREVLEKAVVRFGAPHEKQFKAAAQKLLGGVYFRLGQLDSAYRNWRSAISLDPEDLELIVNLAAVQMAKGNYDEAIRGLKRVLETDETNPKVLSNLGSSFYLKGDYQQAVHFLQKALKASQKEIKFQLDMLAPVDPSTLHKRLGYAYYHLHNLAKAAEHFQAACRLRSEVPCHKELGRIYFEQKNWSQAVSEFEKVLREESGDASLYGMLGSAWLQLGRYEQAQSAFEKGLKQARAREGKAFFYKQLGNLYLKKKEWARARDAFREASFLNYPDAETHFGLALAYLGANELREAKQSLKATLRLQPDHAQALRILSQLKRQSPSKR